MRAQDTVAIDTKSASIPESPEYREAIEQAVQAFQAGTWIEARVGFARAHALSPSARTLRGLGLCSFYLADYVMAREALEAALIDTRRPLPADQRNEITALLARAAQETGRYELRVSPASAKITIDGISRSGPAVVLARGEHVLRALAEGFDSHESRFSVHGGEQATLDIVLLARPASVPALAPAAVAEVAPAEPGPSVSHTSPSDGVAHADGSGLFYTWIALAGVPVFGGVGAGVWFAGLSEHAEIKRKCDAMPCSKDDVAKLQADAHLDRYATWTTVSLAAAGACAVAAGVAFVLESDSDAAPARASLAVGPGQVSFSVGL